MKRTRMLSGVATATLTLMTLATTLAAPPQDREKTGFDPAPAIEAVCRAMETAGGDPERHAVHLILGFSTGNLSSDPIAGMAMRQVAQQLLNRFLVYGDTVTVCGFETDTWMGLDRWSQPFAPDHREAFWQRWPRSPAHDSTGGSDYNRALVRILDQAVKHGDPAAYVVVLLGNSPISQPPRQGKGDLLSEKSPAFIKALNQAGATTLKAQGFPFTTPGNSEERSVWMLVSTPKHLAAPELRGSRSSQLGPHAWVPVDDPYASQLPPPPPPPPPWGKLLAIGALAALGIGIWKGGLVRPGGGGRTTLTMAAEGKTASEWTGPFGKALLGRVVGTGYADGEMQPHDIPVGRNGQMPPRVLLEIHGDGRAVRLVPQGTEFVLDGVPSPGGAVIARNLTRKVLLKGHHRITPGGPAVPFVVQLEFRIA